MTLTFIYDVVRVLALVTLAITAGAMARYYMTRARMPKWAFVAFACYIIALTSVVIENLSNNGENFQWLQTPFILLGSLACIRGVWPYLKLKHTLKGQPAVGRETYGDEEEQRE